MSAPIISVLMSTYNGEKYIREQLDSIIGQEDVTLHIMIRDDGSTDHTLDILDEYERKYSFITVCRGSNLGVGRSFMSLLKNAPDADYYAFADQDDVWMRDKLSRAVAVIRKVLRYRRLGEYIACGYPIREAELAGTTLSPEALPENTDVPVLYGSNQTLTDAGLNTIGTKFASMPACDFYNSLSRNVMYGCTMVMNHALRKKCCQVPLLSDAVMRKKNHDAFVLYCAYILGVFVYDSESRMLYRQHENNVVGGLKLSGAAAVLDKWHRLNGKENKGQRSKLAGELLCRFNHYLPDEMRDHLVCLMNANGITGVHRLLQDEVMRNSFKEADILIAARGLMNWI